MVKKFILFFCVLSALLLSFCGCGKGEEKETLTAKTVTDTEGNTYSALLDEEGFLVIGDKDGLVVCVADENGKPGKNSEGEYVTKSVSFPRVLISDGELHTKFFRLAIPEGWTSKSDDIVKLVKGKITLTINSKEDMSLREYVNEIKNIMWAIGKADEEEAALSFGNAVKLSYENRVVIYVFRAENRIYSVKITADEKAFEEENFEEIINTIKFRKGE